MQKKKKFFLCGERGRLLDVDSHNATVPSDEVEYRRWESWVKATLKIK
jgi:hypothetical protein